MNKNVACMSCVFQALKNLKLLALKDDNCSKNSTLFIIMGEDRLALTAGLHWPYKKCKESLFSWVGFEPTYSAHEPNAYALHESLAFYIFIYICKYDIVQNECEPKQMPNF